MAFSRGYRPKRTEEIFVVESLNTRSAPTTYHLKDWEGEKVLGSFYYAELQKVAKPQDFQVEEVLAKRRYKKTNAKEYYVKWLGYPSKFNSWVHERDTNI